MIEHTRRVRPQIRSWPSTALRGAALCATIAASACSDSTAPRQVPLSGTVVLFDAWASRLDDFSGVTVTIDGSVASATTDATGAWHLPTVPVGPHDITFKKSGFTTVQLLAQSVADTTTAAPTVNLAITPWQQAIIDSIYVGTRSGRDYYIVDGHLSAPPPANAKATSVIAFLGRSDSVAADPSLYDQWNLSINTTANLSNFSVALNADGVRANFGAGAHVFATAYAASVICSCVPDQPPNKPVFPNVGPRANVVPFTLR
jgi:hypothetical protein